MALIQNAKKGREDGGYSRLFGNSDLGALVSKTHATSISAGTELEKLISQTHGSLMTASQLGDWLGNQLAPGTYLIDKPLIRVHLKTVIQSSTEPDFIVIVIVDSKVFVIELKDGDTFDTKKVDGEVRAAKDFGALLHSFLLTRKVSHKGLPYTVEVRFCCFNQSDKEKIVTGLKGRISKKEAMTGDEFCKLIGISYQGILAKRAADQAKNLAYFLDELVKIQSIAHALALKLQPAAPLPLQNEDLPDEPA